MTTSTCVVTMATGSESPESVVHGRASNEAVRLGATELGPQHYMSFCVHLVHVRAWPRRCRFAANRWPLELVTVRLRYSKFHVSDRAECETRGELRLGLRPGQRAGASMPQPVRSAKPASVRRSASRAERLADSASVPQSSWWLAPRFDSDNSMLGRLTLIIGVALALGLVAPNAARADVADDEPGCVHPPLENLRYDEDNSFLRVPACHADLWDPVKYIPLSFPLESYLTLGAHLRERYEYFHNQDWGRAPDDGYVLTRLMIFGDLHLGAHVRLFAELATQFVAGRAGGPGPLDQDLADVHQAFVDLSAEVPRLGPLTLRGGRQELDYARGRLIAVREGANVRLSFDGLRAIQRVGDWELDLLLVSPVETDPGVFDDGWTPGQRLWGIYSRGPAIADVLDLDAYYLGFDRDEASFEQGIANDDRHSLGVVLSGEPRAFDYNVELVYQLGSFGDGNIRAWAVSSDLGYTFGAVPWKPRLGTQLNAMSGDNGPGDPDLETFFPMFPRQSYFSEANLIGPVNLYNVTPVLIAHPFEPLALSLAWDGFWRESLEDGLYRPSGIVQVEGAGNPERYIGGELNPTVQWRTRHLLIVASYSHFFAGPFLRAAGLGRDVDAFTFWVSYRI